MKRQKQIKNRIEQRTANRKHARRRQRAIVKHFARRKKVIKMGARYPAKGEEVQLVRRTRPVKEVVQTETK